MRSSLSMFSALPLKAKLLLPVIATIIVLVGATLFVVNKRFTRQLHENALQAVRTASAVFLESFELRSANFASQVERMAEDPRLRSISTLNDAATTQRLLQDILNESSFESAAFFTPRLQPLALATEPGRQPDLQLEDLLQRQEQGEIGAYVVARSGRLYIGSAAPVTVSNAITGYLVLEGEVGQDAAQELQALTQTEIVLFAGDALAASAIHREFDPSHLLSTYRSLLSVDRQDAWASSTITSGDSRYLATAGLLPGAPEAGFVILSSYEAALENLLQTQRTLLLFSLFGILASAVVLFVLVGQITRPLSQLRRSAEAVGKGDFSQRVPISSGDEVGALAQVFNQMMENLESSRAQLEAAHRDLVETSRRAGMAEVATSVLHNVGNVLNSVNVSTSLITDSVSNSGIDYLARLVELLQKHEHRLAEFLREDPAGKQVPIFLRELRDSLEDERRNVLLELQNLSRCTEHIREIVSLQQQHAKGITIQESLSLEELLEDAIKMESDSWSRHSVKLVRFYEPTPKVVVQRHKLLQILVNLLHNAKQSVKEQSESNRYVTLRLLNAGENIELRVEDNGVGIPPENLTRIFTYGFTTKKDGHGFGLHSCAIAASEMGGSLTAHSDGPGLGARFTLTLPLTQQPAHSLQMAAS